VVKSDDDDDDDVNDDDCDDGLNAFDACYPTFCQTLVQLLLTNIFPNSNFLYLLHLPISSIYFIYLFPLSTSSTCFLHLLHLSVSSTYFSCAT
jgi:hypothetical protein